MELRHFLGMVAMASLVLMTGCGESTSEAGSGDNGGTNAGDNGDTNGAGDNGDTNGAGDNGGTNGSDDNGGTNGSDDNGGTNGSGIEGSKKGNELSEEEALTLCRAVNSTGPDDQEYCTLTSLLAVSDEQTCEAYVTDCLDDMDDPCTTAAADLTDCVATVSDIEECFNQYGQLLSNAASGLTCDDAGKQIVNDRVEELNNQGIPMICTEIANDCPGVFREE